MPCHPNLIYKLIACSQNILHFWSDCFNLVVEAICWKPPLQLSQTTAAIPITLCNHTPTKTPTTQVHCSCVERLTDKRLDNWTNTHSDPHKWGPFSSERQLSKLTAGNDISNICHLPNLSENISFSPNQHQLKSREYREFKVESR